MKKVIGYQIESADGKHFIPLEFYSFEIFTSEDADKWLDKNNAGNEWVKVPIHAGDIEKPTLSFI